MKISVISYMKLHQNGRLFVGYRQKDDCLTALRVKEFKVFYAK